MAIVSDQYAAIGDDVQLVIYYDDALAVDDPLGPPGNKWVVDACAIDHFEINIHRVNEVELEIEAVGGTWRSQVWNPTGNPNQQTFNWNATAALDSFADLSRFKLVVKY